MIHWYPPPTLLRTRDIHLLTSNRLSLGFVLKYQCIVQELSRNIMHHTTHHSFALFLAFFFTFAFFFLYINHPRFFIRDFVPSFFVSKTSQSAFTPGLTEAQDMVQNGMLWLEHTPPISCRSRSTRKLVRTQHIPSVKLRPAQRCLFMCRARWSDLEKHLEEETARGKVKNKARQGPSKP